MAGNSRPKRVIHDGPLYGKQFNYMEFGCCQILPVTTGSFMAINITE